MTQECPPPHGRSSVSDDEEKQYLFEGKLLKPGEDDFDTAQWTKSVPTPTIDVVFDANSTTVRTTGPFLMANSGLSYPYNSELVGELQVEFRGVVDAQRSDGLVLGQRTPVWTPSLAFHGQPLAEASDAARLEIGKWFISLAVLVSVLYLHGA